MNARNWTLVGVLVALGLAYIVFFTEWLRPAPIEIASQVRFAIQPPRFGRPVKKPATTQATPGIKVPGALASDDGVRFIPQGLPGSAATSNRMVRVVYSPGQTNGLPSAPMNLVIRNAQPAKPAATKPGEIVERIGAPPKGGIDQSPGGAANVTFSLDDWYKLTRIRVEDVPADGTAPKVVWQLIGQSVPVNSLLYGRDPTGMTPLVPGDKAATLEPGVPYRLILQAGRRRGTSNFTTVPLAPAE